MTHERVRTKEGGQLGVAMPRWVREAPPLMEYEAVRAVIGHAMARRASAGRIVACKPIMAKARAALDRAADETRRPSVRLEAANRASDLFDEAQRLAREHRLPPRSPDSAVLAILGNIRLPAAWRVDIKVHFDYGLGRPNATPRVHGGIAFTRDGPRLWVVLPEGELTAPVHAMRKSLRHRLLRSGYSEDDFEFSYWKDADDVGAEIQAINDMVHAANRKPRKS